MIVADLADDRLIDNRLATQANKLDTITLKAGLQIKSRLKNRLRLIEYAPCFHQLIADYLHDPINQKIKQDIG
jgi:hypothetical protein